MSSVIFKWNTNIFICLPGTSTSSQDGIIVIKSTHPPKTILKINKIYKISLQYSRQQEWKTVILEKQQSKWALWVSSLTPWELPGHRRVGKCQESPTDSLTWKDRAKKYGRYLVRIYRPTYRRRKSYTKREFWKLAGEILNNLAKYLSAHRCKESTQNQENSHPKGLKIIQLITYTALDKGPIPT